jgi:hypothetical protein
MRYLVFAVTTWGAYVHWAAGGAWLASPYLLGAPVLLPVETALGRLVMAVGALPILSRITERLGEFTKPFFALRRDVRSGIVTVAFAVDLLLFVSFGGWRLALAAHCGLLAAIISVIWSGSLAEVHLCNRSVQSLSGVLMVVQSNYYVGDSVVLCIGVVMMHVLAAAAVGPFSLSGLGILQGIAAGFTLALLSMVPESFTNIKPGGRAMLVAAISVVRVL